ncbi:hypothetical protein GF342_03350 [Candidatus Woesearchaeota archaeon]|nr:hypothetical protein [Candidatus Woesearchaeota archaeon]
MLVCIWKAKNLFVSGILAFLWLWSGIVYHVLFFTSINDAAYFFGVLFIIQGLLFVLAMVKNSLSFAFRKDAYGVLALLFVLYALLVYPFLNYVFGHWWPVNPTFGLPCPLTIFTFALLLLTDKPIPKYLVIIPLAWSFVGASAAVFLGIIEDYGLLVVGVLGTFALWWRDKK